MRFITKTLLSPDIRSRSKRLLVAEQNPKNELLDELSPKEFNYYYRSLFIYLLSLLLLYSKYVLILFVLFL